MKPLMEQGASFSEPKEALPNGMPHTPQNPGAGSQLLNAVLQASPAVAPGSSGPMQSGHVLIGTYVAMPEGQLPHVHVLGMPLLRVAHSLIPLSAELLGQRMALSQIGPREALVLGVLWEGHARPEPQTASLLQVSVDGENRIIESQQTLSLRCGEASIDLHADGRIQLRGTYITSHATATQRLVGGSVHVN